MSEVLREEKILEIELDSSKVGNFTFMINWNFRGDDFSYASYEEDYGLGDRPSERSYLDLCNHEWIDVGFNHPKFVCKKCDEEKKAQ